MHDFKSVAFAAVSCAVVAGSLSAQTGTGQVRWAGVNGAFSFYLSSDGTTESDLYTAPYQAQFQINQAPSPLLPPAGTSSFGPVWDIFCVDFNHNSNQTSAYAAWFTNLGTGTLGTFTRSNSLQNYLAAAFLSEQIVTAGVNTQAAFDMNGAMWQIMSGEPMYRRTSGLTPWSASGITEWVNKAMNDGVWGTAGWKTVNASNWVVVTPTDFASQGSSQEFITQVAPEPATLLLMGTGLLGILLAAGALRRPVA